MRLADVPVVGDILESGVEDRVFRLLLLAGPILIVVIAILGRSAVTAGITVAFIVVFVTNVLYNGLKTRR